MQAFDQLLVDSRMQKVSITTEIVSKALNLQQKLFSLKAFDSLQLGATLVHNCDVFITNDKRLIQLNQPQIITLDQWN
ncbi:PIN domain-containing protein [Spirosoma sp.]|uniref:PIN domain-containing protein n=1 Tax=Spirosoma sp. TaxID=1899569 RepID=UPI0034356B44